MPFLIVAVFVNTCVINLVIELFQVCLQTIDKLFQVAFAFHQRLHTTLLHIFLRSQLLDQCYYVA